METQNEAFHPYISVRRPSDGRRWCPRWLGFATHRNFQVGGRLNYGISLLDRLTRHVCNIVPSLVLHAHWEFISPCE